MLQKEILTIGILAHVDAGKTSLTESFLYKSGTTKSLGSVDKESAVTDASDLERERGISIKTSTINFEWKGKHIQIVDTPGHIDFSSEVDRAFSVLDMVILLVSAKEGVQAHTINLWESIRERGLPVLVFINKIDREGTDLEQVFMDFEKDLGAKLFALNYADNTSSNEPKVYSFIDTKPFQHSLIIEKSFENLAEFDEDFLEQYLDGTIDELDSVFDKAQYQIQEQKLVGCIFGSAKFDLGIELLLGKMLEVFNNKPTYVDSKSAKVFKVQYDAKIGRLAHIRSFGSSIKTKDLIWSQKLHKNIKINQIYKSGAGLLEQVKLLEKGEIGMISSSDLLWAGDVLGEEKINDNYNLISQPVMGIQAVASDEKDYQKLGEALEILNIEDPQLDFEWYKEVREFHLKILGPIQTEILKDSLESRFGIEANFLSPKVIYKETPKATAEGYVRYWMPKPCWAIMTFLIEPAEPETGVTFNSKVRSSDVSTKYLNEVKRALPWALKQGIKGWEVTDINITLTEGSEHNVHSNPGDFLLATPMGIMRGLELADTDLLEPMYRFNIKAHQDVLGAISSDLNQMKAQINAPVFQDDFFTLTGRVSVEKSMNYSIKFNSTTSGKGRLKLTLDGYEKTNTTKEKVRAYKGVSPLDEAQWILHNRGAFKAEERH